tara:strand:- start:3869 stop:5047 length:1179 start_codon:yes stop_codon:yes gene_type:complete
MEFFNKKQDVIDLQLTSYGKQLLSRGLFKPVFYSFSDDGVIYDNRWVTGSNHTRFPDSQQSHIETRIQEETPRLKTQARKVGAEKAVFNSFTSHEVDDTLKDFVEATNQADFFEKLQKINMKAGFAESEKLLTNLLGTKSFQNNFNPAWNALVYNGEISGSAPNYKKNNVFAPVPQLNCTLTDVAYRMSTGYDPYEVLSKPKNVQEGMENYSNILEFGGETQEFGQDGVFFQSVGVSGEYDSFFDAKQAKKDGTFFIEKDFLFLSLEEANVDFSRENFMIEIFEVTTIDETGDGEEELEKLFFRDETVSPQDIELSNLDYLSGKSVESIFNIEVDNEINSQLGCYLIGKDEKVKKQSLYVSNVFDCEDRAEEQRTSIDPYSNLPEVDVGEIC